MLIYCVTINFNKLGRRGGVYVKKDYSNTTGGTIFMNHSAHHNTARIRAGVPNTVASESGKEANSTPKEAENLEIPVDSETLEPPKGEQNEQPSSSSFPTDEPASSSSTAETSSKLDVSTPEKLPQQQEAGDTYPGLPQPEIPATGGMEDDIPGEPFRMPRARAALPERINLFTNPATSNFFPPLISQNQLGACSSFSITYHAFTYAMARLRPSRYSSSMARHAP